MSDLMGETMPETNVEPPIPTSVVGDDDVGGVIDAALATEASASEAETKSQPEPLLLYFQYTGNDADEAALHNYAAAFAATIIQRVPGEDRGIAIRKVREALMFACAGRRLCFGQAASITPAVALRATAVVAPEAEAPAPAPAPALVPSGTWSGLPDDQRAHLMSHLSFHLHAKRGLLAQAAKRVGVRYQTLHRWLQGVNAPMHTATGDLILTILIEQANESLEALLALPRPVKEAKEEAPTEEVSGDAPVGASEDGAEPSTN